MDARAFSRLPSALSLYHLQSWWKRDRNKRGVIRNNHWNQPTCAVEKINARAAFALKTKWGCFQRRSKRRKTTPSAETLPSLESRGASSLLGAPAKDPPHFYLSLLQQIVTFHTATWKRATASRLLCCVTVESQSQIITSQNQPLI